MTYFLAGAFAALGALIIEIILDSLGLRFGFSDKKIALLIIFVVVEEIFKLLVIQKKVNFALPVQNIIANCFWIGLGFGLLELGILLLNDRASYSGNAFSIAMVLLLHLVSAILIGLFIAHSKIKGYFSYLAVVPALVLHLIFNYWVFVR